MSLFKQAVVGLVIVSATYVFTAVRTLVGNERRKRRRRRLREDFTAAALAGLLADHKDHADECMEGESCPAAVARLAVQLADETIKRLEKGR